MFVRLAGTYESNSGEEPEMFSIFLFYLYLPGFSIIFFCSLFRAKVTPKLGKSDDVPLQLPNVKFIL